MTTFDFNSRFKELTGHAPFEWQRRLFEKHFMQGNLPSALDLPTGLGKTSVMTIWYLARRAGAPVPRRLVYVVDRRAVVDQATAVAESIKQGSRDSALRISTLRGRYADNRQWLEDPAAPAIVVGTVDMIGSCSYQLGYLLEMIHLAETRDWLCSMDNQIKESSMAQKGPGKAHREGTSIMELADMFLNEESAIVWFESVIWPNGRNYTYI